MTKNFQRPKIVACITFNDTEYHFGHFENNSASIDKDTHSLIISLVKENIVLLGSASDKSDAFSVMIPRDELNKKLDSIREKVFYHVENADVLWCQIFDQIARGCISRMEKHGYEVKGIVLSLPDHIDNSLREMIVQAVECFKKMYKNEQFEKKKLTEQKQKEEQKERKRNEDEEDEYDEYDDSENGNDNDNGNNNGNVEMIGNDNEINEIKPHKNQIEIQIVGSMIPFSMFHLADYGISDYAPRKIRDLKGGFSVYCLVDSQMYGTEIAAVACNQKNAVILARRKVNQGIYYIYEYLRRKRIAIENEYTKEKEKEIPIKTRFEEWDPFEFGHKKPYKEGISQMNVENNHNPNFGSQHEPFVLSRDDIEDDLKPQTEEIVNAILEVKQNAENGIETSYEEVLESIKNRDRIDSTREVSPLRKADDAIVISTDNFKDTEGGEAVYQAVKKTLENKKLI